MPNPHSQSSSEESSTVEESATPALLKTKSTDPCSSITFSGRSNTACLFPTSTMCFETPTLYFFNNSAVSFRVSSFISTKAMFAPALANSIANSLPIPDPEPVITATLFLKSFIIQLFPPRQRHPLIYQCPDLE